MYNVYMIIIINQYIHKIYLEIYKYVVICTKVLPIILLLKYNISIILFYCYFIKILNITNQYLKKQFGFLINTYARIKFL